MERRYEELMLLLSRPHVIEDKERMKAVLQERRAIERVVEDYREYKRLTQEIAKTEALLGADPEIASLVQEEIANLRERQREIQAQIERALVPQDQNDERDIIMEIRAGVGGEEASLFAADLFRMYARYAQNKGWEVEPISQNVSEIGGFKEVIFEIRGKGTFGKLKYESGVHRVQRVPLTEAGGRIHTSTATVAVLPQVEEQEVDISPNDLQVEFFRSSGPGGQNVNKLSTAVRIIHLPTKITVVCQDERSQWKNRAKAMKILRARLKNMEEEKKRKDVEAERRSQVGSGDRAEKIRTYNLPQERVTDHRIGVSFHNLSQIMEGNLDDIISSLENEITKSAKVSQGLVLT
jgi:peptide chain release factor 1